MADPDLQCIVYDIGSLKMKIGFSGDDLPRAVFPNVVGRPRIRGIMVGMDAKDCFVGDEAEAKRGILTLNFPVKGDRNDVDYRDLEKIFHHCPYNELCISPEEHPFLVTSLHHMSEKDYQKLSTIQFEMFNIPAFYIIDPQVLALYSNGITTGVSLDCGHGITRACCIYGGLPIQKSKIILEDQSVPPRKRIGGDLMTDLFIQMLSSKGNFVPRTTSEKVIAREIKEKFATLRDRNEKYDDWEKEMEFELPDGKKVMIGNERFQICEILFRPNTVGYRLPGIHELVKMSIEECHNDLHEEMFSNVVISGGCTKISNFKQRLKQEIKQVIPKEFSQKLEIKQFRDVSIENYYKGRTDDYWDMSYRKNELSTWRGGSVVSSLPSFLNQWITKEEYDDYGYSIMERRCQDSIRHNDQREMFGRFQNVLDTDLKDRMEYIIHEDDFHGIQSFSIVFLSVKSSVDIKFRSLLLL